MDAASNPNLIEGLLANSELLRGAEQAELAHIAAQCWSLDVRRGDCVVAKGERIPGVLAVTYGAVKLVLRNGATKQRIVRLVHAGEMFGEAAALAGHPAAYDALALTPSRLVVIPSCPIFSLADRNPRLGRQVILTLARRNLELLAELESSSLSGGTQRLAAYLRSLAAASSNGCSRSLRLPATKTVIASRLDMKKETLSRLLRAFASQGLITVQGSDVTVLDPARLGQLG